MRRRILAIAVAAGAALLLAGCTASAQRKGLSITGGDPVRGAAAIGKYGCGSCHQIRGLAGARGQVGPPLTGIAARAYVAGVLPNTPENIVNWIHDPKAVDEKTLMPTLGVTTQDASDIAAYLYTH